jgi:antitoxin component YwqK of YwqJK toxin-antitoxin module
MKRGFFYLLLILFFLAGGVSAQKTVETWYDANWEETPNVQTASYYSLNEHTDSGWFRKDIYLSTKKYQMLGLFEDKENKIRNGVFRFFYPDGKLKSIGKFSHGQKEGLHLSFFEDGSLKDSAFYTEGHLNGRSAGWYSNGNQEYEINFDGNGNGVYTAWFENGSPSAAGRYKNFGQKNGRWQFFHDNGKISAVELYVADSISAAQYFNEDGSPATDTSQISSNAVFPGGQKAWTKFINNHLYFPSNLDFSKGHTAAVVVIAHIDASGKIVRVEKELPLHPDMDKIAVNALMASPAWSPAKNHNRRVASTFRYVVTFSRSYQ